MARRQYYLFFLVLVPVLFAAEARAGDKEPTAIVELGPAGEWGLPGSAGYGPSLAVEFTPIKDWLEIEVGAARMLHGSHGEWDTDLLFKKPFTLSDQVEFMVGIGPQWTISRQGTRAGAEFALDFMFWPTTNHAVGWFIEPTYSYAFSRGHEQSLGTTVGLLILIP